jgi:hypothetical protein
VGIGLLIQCGVITEMAIVQFAVNVVRQFYMNGELFKMDHEEMRKAYHRALNVDKTDFTDFCNLCKKDYISFSGEFIHIITANKKYTIWHCAKCTEKELV